GPINYSLDQLEQADSALSRIYTALRELAPAPAPQSEHSERFRAVMDDDFNTAEALAVLQNMTREINSAKAAGEQSSAVALGAELRQLGGVLGLCQVDPVEWTRMGSTTSKAEAVRTSPGGADSAAAAQLDDAQIEARVAARLAARKARNWAESDRIRDELAQ